MVFTLQSQSIGLPPILNWGRRAAAAGAANNHLDNDHDYHDNYHLDNDYNYHANNHFVRRLDGGGNDGVDDDVDDGGGDETSHSDDYDN